MVIGIGHVVSGMTLGSRYVVKDQLGRGGMAAVYRAYDPRLDLDVALKVLPPQIAVDPTFVARFRREGQTLAKLTHPNILRLYDLQEDTAQWLYYLVLEYLTGGTLKERLTGRPWYIADALDLLRPVADALDFAHSQIPAVVHRDLKPANVMFSEHQRVVVSDFGLARILSPEGSTSVESAGQWHSLVGHPVGTPQYMAPEQAEGALTTPAADLYALGVLAYELLVGTVPFIADTPAATLIKVARDPLPLPTQLNPALDPPVERVLLKALAKNPSDRFARGVEFVEALGIAGQVTVAPAVVRHSLQVLGTPAGAAVQIQGRIAGTLPCVIRDLARGEQTVTVSAEGFQPMDVAVSLPAAAPLVVDLVPVSYSLAIQGAPEGAEVRLNGLARGRVPCTVDVLPAGEHVLEVTADGFAPFSGSVTLPGDGTVEVRLAPLTYALALTGSPEGAAVEVDGRVVGVLPCTVEGLTAGRYRVSASSSGYQSATWDVDVPAAALAELWLDPEVYTLAVRGTPEGARVRVDGRIAGTLPLEIPALLAGEHTISLDHEGYAAAELPVIVPHEDPVEVRLAPLAYTIAVTGSPEGAAVEVDGAARGNLPCDVDGVPAGSHSVRVSHPGYVPVARKVLVPAVGPLDVRLEPEVFTLAIRGTPAGARVRVDGKAAGTLPLDLAGLHAGPHTITVEHEGHVGQEVQVQLPAAGAVEVRLAPLTYALALTGTPVGATVDVDGHLAGALPCDVDGLSAGRHRVRVYHPGYLAVDRWVEMPGDGTAEIRLEPEVFTLAVGGTPVGATVRVDGRDAGTLPLELTGLVAGEHAISVQQPGYEGFERSIGLPAAGQLTVTLKPIPAAPPAAPSEPNAAPASGPLPAGGREGQEQQAAEHAPGADRVAPPDPPVRLQEDVATVQRRQGGVSRPLLLVAGVGIVGVLAIGSAVAANAARQAESQAATATADAVAARVAATSRAQGTAASAAATATAGARSTAVAQATQQAAVQQAATATQQAVLEATQQAAAAATQQAILEAEQAAAAAAARPTAVPIPTLRPTTVVPTPLPPTPRPPTAVPPTPVPPTPVPPTPVRPTAAPAVPTAVPTKAQYTG